MLKTNEKSPEIPHPPRYFSDNALPSINWPRN